MLVGLPLFADGEQHIDFIGGGDALLKIHIIQ